MRHMQAYLPDSAPIDVVRIIHRGKRNWLFEGRSGEERYALKLPNKKSDEGCSAAYNIGSEIFATNSVDGRNFASISDSINKLYLGESFHACDDLVLKQLVHSEYDTLNRVGRAWNAGVVGIARWDPYVTTKDGPDAVQASDLFTEDEFEGSRSCLVLPYYDEQPLVALPAHECCRVWLDCLPALWTALEASRHGDLNPGNLLIAPDRSFFRLIDPCSISASVSTEQNQYYDEDICFSTSPLFYPWRAPFPLSLGGSHNDSTFIKQLETTAVHREAAHFKREATTRSGRRYGTMPLAICEFAEETLPSAADRCAIGLITYFIFTSDTLIIPDLLQEPAWACSYGYGRPWGLLENRQRLVQEAFAGDYLKSRLAPLPSGLDRLIEGLVNLQITSRRELETAMMRVNL